LADVDTDGTLWFYWAKDFYNQQSLVFDKIDLVGFLVAYDVTYIPFKSLVYSVIISILGLTGEGVSFFEPRILDSTVIIFCL
jgi:hypothetical protein